MKLHLYAGFACVVLLGPATAAFAKLPLSIAPTVTVIPLRVDATKGGYRVMAADEILAAKESPQLDIRVDRPAYVTAILYAKSGASEIINQNATRLWLDGKTPLHLAVARSAPVGVREQELTIYVYAGSQPMAAALAGALNVPCSLLDKGRGDPVDGPNDGRSPPPAPQKPERDKPAPKSDTADGKKSEPPNRGGGQGDTQCGQQPGVSASATLLVVQFRSE